MNDRKDRSIVEPLFNRKSTWRQATLNGLAGGLVVGLTVGIYVGVFSVPQIKMAVRGLGGALTGSLIIGAMIGPIGGLGARRTGRSPVVGGAALTAIFATCIVGYLVMTYGARQQLAGVAVDDDSVNCTVGLAEDEQGRTG